MATVTHPLALAAAKAHPWDDAVRGAQAQGEALDARLAGLSELTEANVEARTQLVALARDLGAAAGAQASGATPAYWRWLRSGINTIRHHARRLGYDPEALDLRGPNWTPL